MREIKFRALGNHENNKTKWIYGTSIREKIDDNNSIHSLATFERLLQGNHLQSDTRCQYTGLKDKNQKEIYEGDIVKAKQMFNVHSQVLFYSNGWCFDVPNSGREGWCERITYIGDIEVIGNIYENPKLLIGA